MEEYFVAKLSWLWADRRRELLAGFAVSITNTGTGRVLPGHLQRPLPANLAPRPHRPWSPHHPAYRTLPYSQPENATVLHPR